MIRSIALVAVIIGFVSAHSWLGCADYRITQPSDAEVFVPDNCKAYGRNWKNLGNPTGTFGLDNGYDFGTSAPSCRDALPAPLSSGYNTQFNMAQYAPGQNVCLAWPAKNHVAASCNNPNIPDNGLNIWVSGANPTANPTAGSLTLVKEFPKNTAADQYAGFQNCPKFCGNQDKATCTGCFTVPSNLQVGATYTFVWAWAFNGASQLYSNCWEAEITSAGANTPIATSANPITSQQPTTQTSQATTQTSQRTSQMTSQTNQQPSTTTSGSDCISQCVTVCGVRGVASCNCNGGFNVECNKKDDESTSSASILAISALTIASAMML